MIPKADYFVSLRYQIFCSLFVILSLLQVLAAVYFDNQSCFRGAHSPLQGRNLRCRYQRHAVYGRGLPIGHCGFATRVCAQQESALFGVRWLCVWYLGYFFESAAYLPPSNFPHLYPAKNGPHKSFGTGGLKMREGQLQLGH